MAKTTQSKTPAGEHYAILQLGVSIWNQWRASEPFTIPNLKNTDLTGFHLENINLCRANLQGASLCNAYLYEADFQAADLRGANLMRAGLIGANLHKANLAGANIKQAYLAQSDLSNANLTGAYLQKADLQSSLLAHATFLNARIAEAEFTGCFDLTRSQLSMAKGVHLACFDAPLVGVGSTLAAIPAKKLSAQAVPQQQVFAAEAREHSRSIKAFEPAKSPGFSHPLLRRLAGLNARRNAAVTNVGLS